MTQLEVIEQELYKPSNELLQDLSRIEGDIMLLGAGGKMGPSMAKLASMAIKKAGLNKNVIAVSRFSDESARLDLEEAGVHTIAADLLNEADLSSLPQIPNIIYLAGTKFGTTGNESFTWAMNAYLPGRVAQHFKQSRIVVFSTGNVLPFSKIENGGLSEEVLPAPIGEYGQSCLGRERVFQHFSKINGTPVLIYRLNYAIDLHYGVLLEVAKTVLNGKPVDLTTGNVNVIWQGDANEIALRCLNHCSSPATTLNVTGPETVSIKWLAQQFGSLFKIEPTFINQPQETALLSNASRCHELFGYPRVTLRQMIYLTANWLASGGKTINKPTHFQERQGQF